MKAGPATLRPAIILWAALIPVGCSGERTPQFPTVPTAPVATASKPVDLRGLVISSSGDCIESATIEVVNGQALGQKASQSTPCDHWDYRGGFIFKDLTPGVAMTLRASAPGWGTREEIVTPASFISGQPYWAIEFVLVQDAQTPRVQVESPP
jgi:hypothetical protein